MFSWLWCCGAPADEVDESARTLTATQQSGKAEPVSPSDKMSLDAAVSPTSTSTASSIKAKRDSLRAFSAAFETEAIFPDEGVVYEVLGLKYERGTLRSNPSSKGEVHLQKVESSAREAREVILSGALNMPPIAEEEPNLADVLGVDGFPIEPLDITHVQSLLKVSLVLADVLQLQGKVEEADHILGDTLDRLLDTALEQSARISESQANANPTKTADASPASKEAKALPMRLKAAAHHRMGSIKRSQGDFSSAETHLRAAADILGQCAAAGDTTANSEKAATLALLATILMR